MKIGRVIGSVWATRKDERLDSRRLLLVQPMTFRGAATGGTIIALDTVDSGPEDIVIYATSAEAAIPFQPGLTPTDATIVGVVDQVQHEEWTYRSG